MIEDTLWRRRMAIAASTLALGGFGGLTPGCGDDESSDQVEDEAQEGEADDDADGDGP